MMRKYMYLFTLALFILIPIKKIYAQKGIETGPSLGISYNCSWGNELTINDYSVKSVYTSNYAISGSYSFSLYNYILSYNLDFVPFNDNNTHQSKIYICQYSTGGIIIKNVILSFGINVVSWTIPKTKEYKLSGGIGRTVMLRYYTRNKLCYGSLYYSLILHRIKDNITSEVSPFSNITGYTVILSIGIIW